MILLEAIIELDMVRYVLIAATALGFLTIGLAFYRRGHNASP